jgi:integrase
MSKRLSLVRQVTLAFERISHIGESRHAAKAAGVAHAQIHSYASARTHRQRVITGLRRLNAALPPDQRIRMLRDLRPAHLSLLKSLMLTDGLADVTIRNELSSWRKLAHALNATGWNSIAPTELVPAELYTGLSQSSPRGGYSPEQAEQIISHIERTHRRGAELGQMARLVLASGLRHTEVARLRESDLDRDAGDILVRSSNAKGGRRRLITISTDGPCRTSMREAINAIPTYGNWLFLNGPSLARQLQDAMRDACDDLGIKRRGIHGLRGTFAERYLIERINAGLSEDDARDELTKLLGHNRRSVTYRYVGRLS